MKTFSAIFIFCATLTGVAQAQTAAATAPPVAITGWRVECDSQGVALNCHASDQVAQGNLNIAAFGVQLAADTKKPVLTMQLPLGMAVTDPVILSVDTMSQNYPLITCDRGGCFARAPISDGLLEKMRAGKAPLKVQYNLINATLVKQTVTLTIPLNGFDASLAKIK